MKKDEKMSIEDMTAYMRIVPERKASYAEFPDTMNDEIKEYLRKQGINALYTHQTEMFEKAGRGENTVITTSTASGKTLAFLIPVLQKILEDPLTRAIFVYPTKALASDQYRSVQPVLEYFGEGKIQAGRTEIILCRNHACKKSPGTFLLHESGRTGGIGQLQ